MYFNIRFRIKTLYFNRQQTRMVHHPRDFYIILSRVSDYNRGSDLLTSYNS
jgi:hypothetical protein